MKVTRYFLWNDLITYVINRTADINNILHSRIVRIGIYSDVKDTEDAGLRGTCEELLGEISELYDRVLEIKTQCAFIEEPKEKENKNEKL